MGRQVYMGHTCSSSARRPGQGRVHPSETMMHFLLFQISSLFSKKFQTLRKIFTILPFAEKFLDFHPPKFQMTFFQSSTTNFPPCFAKIIVSPPTLTNFPLFYTNSPAFTYFTCISFPPYFDHDVFMHHPMHVLNAPATTYYYRSYSITIATSTTTILLLARPSGGNGAAALWT